jgi:hypothetical protein
VNRENCGRRAQLGDAAWATAWATQLGDRVEPAGAHHGAKGLERREIGKSRNLVFKNTDFGKLLGVPCVAASVNA